MTNIQRLLLARKAQKKHKPIFLAQDSHKKKRIRKRWVRPRGIHSKIRHRKAGYRLPVRIGYRTAALVRFREFRSGKLPVVVSHERDLTPLDTEQHAVVIAAGVGLRKRSALVRTVHEKGFVIINVKDPAAYPDKVLAAFNARVAMKKKARSEKSERSKKAKKAPAAASATSAASAAEEKKRDDALHEEKNEEKRGEKNEEKKEKDKLLVTKG